MDALTTTLSALAISTKTPVQTCVEALIAEIAKTSPTKEKAHDLIREITTTLTDTFCKEPSITTAATNSAAASSTLSILPAAPPKKSRGGASLKKGTAYEDVIRELLAKYTYNELVIDVAGKTAGAGHGQDVQFIVADITVNVECKDKGAFEGGGKTYKNVENTLVFPEECLHKTLLEGYIPFGGRVPSFLKGDKTLATWETEKTMFKDEHTNVPDTTVADYYRSKGIHYIQVEGKGLYTTGYDILELGVPLFKCETRIRIRCKRHGSSTMPGSVQAAFVYTKKSISPSPVDFQKKLPIKFKKAAI